MPTTQANFYEDPFQKQFREKLEAIQVDVSKMKLKDIRREATELTHENNWSGLYGFKMTRLRVLEAEYLKRTKTDFFVEKIVYP